MNINEKKIYMRANELYKEGKTAEAIKLWSSINQTKKNVIDIEPLIWKLKNINYFLDMNISVYVVYSCLILLSFFFGKFAFIIFKSLGDLISFNSYPDIQIFLSNLSIDEQMFGKLVNDPFSITPFFERYYLAFQQYFVSKIIHVQTYYFTGNAQVSIDSPIQFLIFNSSLGLSILLVSIAAIGDLFLFWKVSKGVTLWLITLLKKSEFRLRLFIAITITFICYSFFIMVYKTFKKNEPIVSSQLMNLSENAPKSGDGSDNRDSNENLNGNKKESDYKSERQFLEDFTNELSRRPYSIREREAITRMYNDYIKLLKKYGIKGGQQAKQPTVEEIIEAMKGGKISELENELKKMKALNDYKRLQGEMGEGGGEISEEDKEFAEVLKKSFMSSDKKTLDEYLKTGKELEELYGKGIKDKVFSGEKQKELIKKFKNDPLSAREFAREEINKLLENESNDMRFGLQSLDMDLMTRINSIINYLEGGGDIKVFNQMRVQFLKDYDDPQIRFQFARRIDFVMASWNEHQSKYFWEMNRALTMEIIDMLKDAAKGVNYDVRGMHLGWFYLVAGYYEKAREECLGSIELEESFGVFESESSNVNRSNAALAALMLQKGKTAFLEYRWIYQKVLEKKGYYRAKREEMFTEYIREITAAIASPSPCKEAYLCRSMFLEDVNDDLALNDLLKYLALSPDDDLLIREANLKINLIKSRLEKRKLK